MKIKKIIATLICSVFLTNIVSFADSTTSGIYTYTSASVLPSDFDFTNAEAYFENQKKSRYEHIYSIIENLGLANVSDKEKVRRVHDYLCDTHVYGEAGAMADGQETSEYVCALYAMDFCHILTLAGLNVEYIDGAGVTSDGKGPHAWNKVYIDNKWYYVDVTWDDCHRDNGDYSDKWFMITYDQMSQDHIEKLSYPLTHYTPQ